MANLALEALGMAERGITKMINKMTSSQLAAASVADGKRISAAGADAINVGLDSARGIAAKSQLVGYASAGAHNIAKDVAESQYSVKGMEMANKLAIDARSRTDALFGGNELIDTAAKQRRYENAVRYASGGSIDAQTAAMGGQAARMYGTGIDPVTGKKMVGEAGEAIVKPIPMTAEQRLHYRYRRPNGSINKHMVGRDAGIAAAGVAGVGAVGMGAVSYFGGD